MDFPRETMGPIVSLGVSMTVFLRKTIANCDFSVTSRPGSPTLDTPMIQLDSRLNVKLLMIKISNKEYSR